MLIKGLQKLTLLDYAGQVACTVFTGGCNFRCPYCHNASLVLPELMGETIQTEEFYAFLDSRKNLLTAVCVSGGEPTLQPDIKNFLSEIKARGFLVKLDTNGTRPAVLRELIDAGLIDYVAMDIKNSPDRYVETVVLNSEYGKVYENASSGKKTFSGFSLADIEESVKILMEGRVEYEFRTTLVKELHTIENITAIGRWLKGSSLYYLQSYRPGEGQIIGGFTPFTDSETEQLLSELRKYVPNAQKRG